MTGPFRAAACDGPWALRQEASTTTRPGSPRRPSPQAPMPPGLARAAWARRPGDAIGPSSWPGTPARARARHASMCAQVRRRARDPTRRVPRRRRRHPPGRAAIEARYADLPEGLDARLAAALAVARHRAALHPPARGLRPRPAGPRAPSSSPPRRAGRRSATTCRSSNAILAEPGSRALYLFPTKALARDQAAELQEIMQAAAPDLATAVYDGDTPPAERRVIRDRAHVVISNPDMLHTAVLPHHARWMRVFENLKYVVIDEIHTYRGVFGSHLANVLRRLRRVCRFHGSDPDLHRHQRHDRQRRRPSPSGCSSAPSTLVEENGAPLGERHFLVVNPPVVNPALGLRASYLTVAREVASTLPHGAASTRSSSPAPARSTEVMTKYLKDLFRQRVDRKPTRRRLPGRLPPARAPRHRAGPARRLDPRRRLHERPRAGHRHRLARRVRPRRLPGHGRQHAAAGRSRGPAPGRQRRGPRPALPPARPVPGGPPRVPARGLPGVRPHQSRQPADPREPPEVRGLRAAHRGRGGVRHAARRRRTSRSCSPGSRSTASCATRAGAGTGRPTSTRPTTSRCAA